MNMLFCYFQEVKLELNGESCYIINISHSDINLTHPVNLNFSLIHSTVFYYTNGGLNMS